MSDYRLYWWQLEEDGRIFVLLDKEVLFISG